MTRILKPLIFLTLLFFVAVYSVSAQASSGTWEAPLRGEGAATISGYTITNLNFQLGQDPGLLDGVEFDLDAPADQVQLSFDSVPGQPFSCRNETGNHWVCELDQVQLREVEGIHISASG